MRNSSQPRRQTLSFRLQLAFLALGLTAIAATGGLAFHEAQNALEAATYERLTAVRETKKRQIEAYFRDALAIVEALGRDESAADALLGFQATWPTGGEDYQAVRDLHHEGLAAMTAALGFKDLLLIDPAEDAVLYAAYGKPGARMSAPAWRDSSLGRAFRSVLAAPFNAKLADYDVYPPEGDLAAYAVAPVWNRGSPIGAVAVRLSIQKIDEIMTGNGRWRAEGLGESGETYLVGSDGLMRSDSRFLIQSPEQFFTRLVEFGYSDETVEQIRSRGTTVLTQNVDTEAVRRSLAGEAATSQLLDYRGVEVLSAFAPLELPDLRWSLLSEIDAREAFQPVRDLRRSLVGLGLAVSLVFMSLGYSFSKRTTEPLRELTGAVERLGRLDWKEMGGLGAFARADDEVARLAEQFDAVSRRLRDTTVSRDHLDDLLGSMLNAVLTIGPVRRQDGSAPDSPQEPIVIQSANPAAALLLGYEVQELEGLRLQRILGSGAAEPVWLEALRRDGRLSAVEKTLTTRDGATIPVLFTAALINAEGAAPGAVCVAQDITDRKAAEQQLQALARRLLVAQEQERGRLARELHDDVTQRLGALAIDAGKLAAAAETEPVLGERVRSLQESAIRLAHDVQSLSRRLHPSILEDLGLPAALRAEVQALRDRLEIAVSFAAEAPPAGFPKESALALYRVAQECFQNISRHAGATEVNVELSVIGEQVRLSIEDDGVGFDAAEARGRGGLGLASLEERARLAGGRLQIRTAPGKGAKMVVEVPVQP